MNRNLPEVKEGIESKRQSGIDYGVYGAKYIYDLSGEYGPNGRIVGELLANVICYHHGGLPDAEDFNGDSPLLMRLQDENRLTDYEQVKVAFFKDLQIKDGRHTPLPSSLSCLPTAGREPYPAIREYARIIYFLFV